jgi:hypothetical protein
LLMSEFWFGGEMDARSCAACLATTAVIAEGERFILELPVSMSRVCRTF